MFVVLLLKQNSRSCGRISLFRSCCSEVSWSSCHLSIRVFVISIFDDQITHMLEQSMMEALPNGSRIFKRNVRHFLIGVLFMLSHERLWIFVRISHCHIARPAKQLLINVSRLCWVHIYVSMLSWHFSICVLLCKFHFVFRVISQRKASREREETKSLTEKLDLLTD